MADADQVPEGDEPHAVARGADLKSLFKYILVLVDFPTFYQLDQGTLNREVVIRYVRRKRTNLKISRNETHLYLPKDNVVGSYRSFDKVRNSKSEDFYQLHYRTDSTQCCKTYFIIFLLRM